MSELLDHAISLYNMPRPKKNKPRLFWWSRWTDGKHDIYKQNQCFSTHKPTCISKVVSKYEVSLIKGFVFYRCNQQSPKLLNKGYDISNRHMKKNIHQKCLKLAMKYKGIVSGIKTSKMSAKICKITFPDHGANS